MDRFNDERVKEADAALEILSSSIVPVSRQEVQQKMKAVNGWGWDMISVLVYHYGLVKEQDGYYCLTERGKEAARLGFRKYARRFDRKEAAMKRRRTVETQASELKLVVVDEYWQKRRWHGLYADQWRDLVGWSIAILTLVVSCLR